MFHYVSRSLYQFQVHGQAPPRTVVYDQMEQLFTNRKFHFCYHRNFRVFFLNGKRPRSQRTLIGRNKSAFYWLIGERTKLQRRTQLQRYYGCRNVAKFDKDYFHSIKIYFHSIKIFLCDKNIFSFDKIYISIR